MFLHFAPINKTMTYLPVVHHIHLFLDVLDLLRRVRALTLVPLERFWSDRVPTALQHLFVPHGQTCRTARRLATLLFLLLQNAYRLIRPWH